MDTQKGRSGGEGRTPLSKEEKTGLLRKLKKQRRGLREEKGIREDRNPKFIPPGSRRPTKGQKMPDPKGLGCTSSTKKGGGQASHLSQKGLKVASAKARSLRPRKEPGGNRGRLKKEESGVLKFRTMKEECRCCLQAKRRKQRFKRARKMSETLESPRYRTTQRRWKRKKGEKLRSG